MVTVTIYKLLHNYGIQLLLRFINSILLNQKCEYLAVLSVHLYSHHCIVRDLWSGHDSSGHGSDYCIWDVVTVLNISSQSHVPSNMGLGRNIKNIMLTIS